MAGKLIPLLLCAGSLAVPASAGAAGFETRNPDQRYAPGEALVRFEPGVAAAERREVRDDAGVEFEEALVLPRVQVVTFDGSVQAAVTRLERQPGVADAQPNFRYEALAVSNDSFSGQQWGLEPTPGVGVAAAWPRTQGGGQVIAIVDTGVDLTHPDLQPNLWSNPGEVPGNGLDDDGNGMADDLRGRDFVHGDADPSDHEGHGTHVAGIAAAVTNNGLGVAGVAPGAQIMAVRVLDGDGSGFTSDIADGIGYAASEGAGVINLSLGRPSGSGDAAMQDAIAFAGTRGTVVVAAAGNDNHNNDVTPTSPCNLPNENIICVAALDDSGNLASYSNVGKATVDVAAPGGDFIDVGEREILSTKPSWGVPAYSEGFESGVGAWTGTTNKLAWGVDDIGASGAQSAADSPNANYQPSTVSRLDKTDPIASLAGRQGCRLHFAARLNVNDVDGSGAPFDFVGVGVVSGVDEIGENLFGNTFTSFRQFGISISDLDGRSNVKPSLRFRSDGFVQQDGAYIDDIRIFCRASDYNDVVVPADDFELAAGSGGGSYMAISGTSMAAPHVAGVAALVRATDPDAPATQVVQAIREGAKPSGNLGAFTSTGGAVDAAGALDRVLAMPNPVPPTPIAPAPPPPPAAPARARFGSVSVDRRGVVTIRVFGNPGTTGVLTLRANIVRPSAARLVRVARKTFRIGSTGRAIVKPRLNRAALRQLRRTRRLRLRARVVLRNSFGLTSTATAGLRITLRRR